MTLLVFGTACVSTKLSPISSTGADFQPLKDEQNMHTGLLARIESEDQLATTQLDRVRELMPEDPEVHLLIGELERERDGGCP